MALLTVMVLDHVLHCQKGRQNDERKAIRAINEFVLNHWWFKLS
jgi:hypothetical protein